MRASCPSCDAPVSVSARRCASCGYRLVEDDARPAGERRGWLVPLAVAAGGLAAAIALVAVLAGGGGDEPVAAEPDRSRPPALEVLSRHPLSAREMELLLEERFTGLRDDDGAAVRCSGLEAKPAHAVRRCRVLYPTGLDRLVILITDARGRERLAGFR